MKNHWIQQSKFKTRLVRLLTYDLNTCNFSIFAEHPYKEDFRYDIITCGRIDMAEVIDGSGICLYSSTITPPMLVQPGDEFRINFAGRYSP